MEEKKREIAEMDILLDFRNPTNRIMKSDKYPITHESVGELSNDLYSSIIGPKRSDLMLIEIIE